MGEIFIFRDSLMPEYQRIEKNENIAERNLFDFQTFRSGLKVNSRLFNSVKLALKQNLFLNAEALIL